MTQPPGKLNQFFGTQNLSPETIRQIKARPAFEDIRRQIAGAVSFTVPDSFYDLLIRELDDLLDISFSGLLVRAWQKHQRLKKYLDRQAYPPENMYSEIMLKHTLKSSHRHAIRPVINGVTYKGIEFEVTLALEFESAVLKIQDAYIRRIETGTCQGKGEVAYQGFAIFKAGTQPVRLPGGKDLGDGFPIERLA